MCIHILLIYLKGYLKQSSATGHPWIKNSNDIKVPLDILVFKLMKAYMRSSPLRKAALRVSIYCYSKMPLLHFSQRYSMTKTCGCKLRAVQVDIIVL